MKWASRVKASRVPNGFAEVGTSRNGASVTLRAGAPGTSYGTGVVRLTLDEARELRRALSRAIRDLGSAVPS